MQLCCLMLALYYNKLNQIIQIHIYLLLHVLVVWIDVQQIAMLYISINLIATQNFNESHRAIQFSTTGIQTIL